jgi:carbon storage regulator
MLVLTAKENQRLLVGDDIVITVVEVSRHKCRIGIDAPDTVKVSRWVHVSEMKKQELVRRGLINSTSG